MPEPGYVFVIAQPRSGSTLLMHFLNRLDGVLGRGENYNVLARCWGQRHMVSLLIRDHGRIATDPTNPFFGTELIDQSAVDADQRRFFKDVIIQPRGHERFVGCKEVRFSSLEGRLSAEIDFHACIDWLASWPNAKLIFLVRDSDAAACSGFLRDKPRAETIADLNEQERRFAAAHVRHTVQSHFIRYESFCRSAEHARAIAATLKASNADEAYAEAMGVRLEHT